jgi:hypothetical protein
MHEWLGHAYKMHRLHQKGYFYSDNMHPLMLTLDRLEK